MQMTTERDTENTFGRCGRWHKRLEKLGTEGEISETRHILKRLNRADVLTKELPAFDTRLTKNGRRCDQADLRAAEARLDAQMRKDRQTAEDLEFVPKRARVHQLRPVRPVRPLLRHARGRTRSCPKIPTTDTIFPPVACASWRTPPGTSRATPAPAPATMMAEKISLRANFKREDFESRYPRGY